MMPARLQRLITPIREVVETMPSEMSKATDTEFSKRIGLGMFQPKGQITLEHLLFQSIIGPIGMPAFEAVYPAVATKEGKPMNAIHDMFCA